MIDTAICRAPTSAEPQRARVVVTGGRYRLLLYIVTSVTGGITLTFDSIQLLSPRGVSLRQCMASILIHNLESLCHQRFTIQLHHHISSFLCYYATYSPSMTL